MHYYCIYTGFSVRAETAVCVYYFTRYISINACRNSVQNNMVHIYLSHLMYRIINYQFLLKKITIEMFVHLHKSIFPIQIDFDKRLPYLIITLNYV